MVIGIREMTQKKFERIVVSTTVGAILLLVTLVMVLVYQLITMKIESDKKADFDAKLAYYNQLIEEGNDTLETRQLDKWLEMRAQELGYVYK